MSRIVRDRVLARDDYRCVKCNTTGSKINPLQMHHIVFKCKGGQSREENLETLCANCHRALHRMYKSITRERNPKRRRRR